jgi:hypothetical protein
MRKSNGTLEDIAAVIGFAATLKLAEMYGRADRARDIYIPTTPSGDHHIARAIGESALRLLVAEWGGQTILVSINSDARHLMLVRAVACMVRDGMATRDIAAIVGLGDRQIRRLRVEAEECGLVDRVMSGSVRRAGKNSPDGCSLPEKNSPEG